MQPESQLATSKARKSGPLRSGASSWIQTFLKLVVWRIFDLLLVTLIFSDKLFLIIFNRSHFRKCWNWDWLSIASIRCCTIKGLLTRLFWRYFLERDYYIFDFQFSFYVMKGWFGLVWFSFVPFFCSFCYPGYKYTQPLGVYACKVSVKSIYRWTQDLCDFKFVCSFRVSW